jgi:hypothetical protein
VVEVDMLSTNLLLDDDSNLLDSAVELVEGDLALVVDVEELEALSQESLLTLVGRALLRDLRSHLSLKAAE